MQLSLPHILPCGNWRNFQVLLPCGHSSRTKSFVFCAFVLYDFLEVFFFFFRISFFLRNIHQMFVEVILCLMLLYDSSR